MAAVAGSSPWLYLLTQSQAVWLYLARICCPQELVFDYGDFLSSGLAESGGWLVLTAAVFAGVAYGYARYRRPSEAVLALAGLAQQPGISDP